MVAKYSHVADTLDYFNDTGSMMDAGDMVELGDGFIGIARNPIPDQTLGHLAIGGIFDVTKADATESAAFGSFVYLDASDGTVSLTTAGTHVLVEDNAANSTRAKVQLNAALTAAAVFAASRGAIAIIKDDGTTEIVTPTADTDLARGSAFVAALATAATIDNCEVRLADGFEYQLDAALSATLHGVTITGHAIVKAKPGTDLNYLVKYINNGTLEVISDGVTYDGNGTNCTRSSGIGDTLFVSGSGPITIRNAIIKDGPHDSNTDDGSPSADGSLFRSEGTGLKTLENAELIDAAYSTFRVHSQNTVFRNVKSICRTRKQGAYQRHGYWDSEASNNNMRSFSWDGGGVFDTVAHKVNQNVDPSSNGPHWLESCHFHNLIYDISTNHTNPDSDAFIKVNYVRQFSMTKCKQWHSNIDTVVSGVYTNNVNSASLEYALNIGMCENALIDNCRFDGNIKGIGAGTIQCNVLTVRNSRFGENAYIEHALANVSNFGYVHWENNDVFNVYGGGTGAARCLFDCTSSNSGQKVRLVGRNKFHTRWPTVSGQSGAVFRAANTIVGHIAVDPITIEAETGTMTTVAAFTEEERLACTAYAGDPLTLHLERNIIDGGSLTGIGTGTGTYVATQQQPAGSADYFPDIDGIPGARIWNDNPANGVVYEHVWSGTQWIQRP